MSAAAHLVDDGLPPVCSCIKGDLGYDARAVRLSDQIDVLLDGVVLPEVSAWNVPEGIVTMPLYNEHGHRTLSNSGLPAFYSRKGKVEVRWARKGAAA